MSTLFLSVKTFPGADVGSVHNLPDYFFRSDLMTIKEKSRRSIVDRST